MASPFEAAEGAHPAAAGFRGRSLTRKTLQEKRINTHWKPERDVLWQRNPDRVLKYRPSHLHYYGWIPFAILRNWRATVFSEVYLHVQCCALVAWMAAIHLTGLGVPDADLATLVIMFGNPYLGGIFNYGMVVVFILGLFITLVVNRWWSIRVAYTKLMGTTTDLCMTVASAVQDPENTRDRRIRRARTEITRLLNLGHLLVIAKADAQNEEFKKSKGLRTAFRASVSAVRDLFRGEALLTRASVQSGSPAYTRALYKPRNLLTFETMVKEGYMNEDEWELLKEAENEGMAAFQMVYYWTQVLVNKCRDAEWIISSPQMLPLMLNKINTIAESGSSIINTINSQMPYPYVHLVSLVVHVYLIVLATWFGCFLHTGRIGEKFNLGEAGIAFKADDDINTAPWMIFWCYLLMVVANTSYQGLLDMHTLLDNPFGNHCAKFPLRANVSGVTNASRTMLTMADRLPAAFGDVFPSRRDGDGNESAPASRPSLSPEFADFLNPTPTGQFPLGSIGSWQPSEHDRSSRHSTRAQREQMEGHPPNASLHRRVISGEAHPVPLQPSPLREERRDAVGVAEPPSQEQAVPRKASGDATIQERFLQGAVRNSMKALSIGNKASSSRTQDETGQP